MIPRSTYLFFSEVQLRYDYDGEFYWRGSIDDQDDLSGTKDLTEPDSDL